MCPVSPALSVSKRFPSRSDVILEGRDSTRSCQSTPSVSQSQTEGRDFLDTQEIIIHHHGDLTAQTNPTGKGRDFHFGTGSCRLLTPRPPLDVTADPGVQVIGRSASCGRDFLPGTGSISLPSVA